MGKGRYSPKFAAKSRRRAGGLGARLPRIDGSSRDLTVSVPFSSLPRRGRREWQAWRRGRVRFFPISALRGTAGGRGWPHGEGGEVPKRSNGADCKSAGLAFGGSNPPLSTNSKRCRAGIAQLARARAFQARGRGFEPRFPLHVLRGGWGAHVAQSVEHVLGKDEVGGSIPLLGFCPEHGMELRR